MNSRNLSLFCILLPGFVVSAPIDFVTDVRPIFETHCYDCHSGDKHKSGLRLDVKSAALIGGDNHGPDIVAGDPERSPLIQFILSEDEDIKMPPKGPRLSHSEIAILTRWIEQGASWPDGVDRVELKDTSDHWSFKPLSIPVGKHSIDSFIRAGLQHEGTTLSPPASRRTWLRRVTLDLTGLPPTPEEMRAFLEDESSTARSRVVDRLLDSPRYGERWAQHWLDVVRYADTHGFEVNTERAYAWPYRDYVIRAFNDDLPWDQFIREQIAGEAYGKPEATGFLVTAAALLPGQIGKDDESKRLARQDELGEIVINTGEAFLGLSIGCARCHNHKFDPITSRDYYSMQAFFAGVRYGDRPVENPKIEEIVADIKNRLLPIEKELSNYIIKAGSGETRAPLSAKANLERFSALIAKKLRFSVQSSISNNLRQPFIDELEVFDVDGNNISLEANVISTGNSKEAINDGIYGNKSCWKSRQKGKGEVILEFAKPSRINQVIWGRDRTGQYPDRLAETYTIEAQLENGTWKLVADSTDRTPFDPTRAKASLYQKEDIIPAHWARSRELVAARTPLINELKQYNGGRQLVFAAQSNQPETMYLLNRGDPEQPTSEVTPATMSFLNPVALPREAPDLERRKALAEWIASPDNPLTARVIVNRIWQWHFGIGLVNTPNDFGNLGVAPTHPEFLDWLASELIRSGWSIKELHRMIVLSATYRQSHQITSESNDHQFGRFPSRRLESEAIRDSILAVSGQLDLKMFGRGYDLFHSRGGTGGFRPIESHQKPDGRRRMIYAYKVRMEREAVFGAFDCPDAGQSAPKRSRSTTPIQALNLFNSQFSIDLANDFAGRIQSEVGDDPNRQIQRAWQLALNREPLSEELNDAESVVREHGLPTLCRVIFNTNEFLFLP